MQTVLMVAEKPSVAKSIAEILSHGCMETTSGICRQCPIHTFNGVLQGVSSRFKVTSVTGHMQSTDFPQEYQNWERTDPLLLFSCPIRKVNTEQAICKHIEHEARGCKALVLWLDCDREGENICFEVIHFAQSSLVPGAKILRARFSAITGPDIQKAMSTLTTPNKAEAESVDARQEIDLRVGVAFTRYQTLYFRDRYGDLDSSLVSFGPCQTPTLGFCVQRHDEIQSFQPESFWRLAPTIDIRGFPVRPEWQRGRMFDKDVATLFLKSCEGKRTAKIISCVQDESKKPRPIPLNTVELLKVASKQLHMGPQQAMSIAERLYTSGYISYPRTESSAYPEHYDLVQVVREHTKNSLWGEYASNLLSVGLSRPKSGVDAGDHPPITPTREASPSEIGGDAWTLYEYICRHFLATVSPDCTMQRSKIEFRIGNEEFKIIGHKVLHPGFAAIMPWLLPQNDAFPNVEDLPDEVPVIGLRLEEGKTSAPDYLTESELIGLMESHGIGTDASIPVHINNICTRNFCTVNPHTRVITPTQLGITLVHGYYRIDPELVLPDVRANIESNISLIAKGEAKYTRVVDHVLGQFFSKFQFFINHVVLMDELFGASFTKVAQTDGKMLSRCGKCNRFMTFISLKPARLYCANCAETYSLPQNGFIRELQPEVYCPLDGFQLITYATGSGCEGRCFALCPNCYNTPVLDIEEHSGCNKCPHSDCPAAISARWILQCPSCEEGTVCLDPISLPGKWRASCNHCSFVLGFSKAVKKVTLCKSECEKCGARKIMVESGPVGKAKTVLDPKAKRCVVCDPEVALVTTKTQAVMFGDGKRHRFGRRRTTTKK